MNPESQNPSNPVAPADIDRCCRWPLLFLGAKSIGWLVLGVAMAVAAFAKLVIPEFLSGSAWTTYGRLQPAALNILVYGFASQAAFAVGLWLLARLGRTALVSPFLAFTGAALWNLGVAVGVVGILAGESSGYPFMEMPIYSAGIMLFALLFLAVAVLQTFQARREAAAYPSLLFVVAGLFWFFWIFCVAMGLLLCAPQRGVMQVVVSTWFASNLFQLWLTPLGLAAAFYLVPKLTGKPLYSAPLAKLAFWIIATFGAACGFHDALPLPRWLGAVSSVCEVMLVVAALAVALNLHKTLGGDYRSLWRQPALMLIGTGMVAWIFTVLLQAVISRPEVNGTLQFTWVVQARTCLLIFGFIAPVLLGALFFMIPRLAGQEWPCDILPKISALGFGSGIVLLAGSLLWAGSVQGAAMNTPTTSFIVSVSAVQGCLKLGLAGLALLACGAFAFAANGALLARQWFRACGCCCCKVEKLPAAEVVS